MLSTRKNYALHRSSRNTPFMDDSQTIRWIALVVYIFSILSTTLLNYNVSSGYHVAQREFPRELLVSHARQRQGSITNWQRQHAAETSCIKTDNTSRLALVSILTCVDTLSTNYLWSVMKLITSARHTLLPGEIIDAILLLAGCQDMSAKYKTLLRRAGWTLCHVPIIPGPSHVPSDQNRFLATGMFSKLHAWRLCQYSWVLLVDADTMVLHPFMSDVLQVTQEMERDNLTLAAAPQLATSCSFFECIFSSTEQCRLVYDRGVGFNAGVMVVHPDEARFTWLLDHIDSARYDIGWAEQGLLNAVYPQGEFFELQPRYNYMTFQNPCGKLSWNSLFENNITFIHFTNPKPWDCGWNSPWEIIAFDTSYTCALWENAPIFPNNTSWT